MKNAILTTLVYGTCSLLTVFAAEEAPSWKYRDVTKEVVDINLPGVGSVFDYAFVDLNNDNYLDVITNNHHVDKGSPMWLGGPDGKFTFWQNTPRKNVNLAGFYLGEVDHNGDGKTDLVYSGNEGGLMININSSEPKTLKPEYKSISIKHSSFHISFIDIDGDGGLETLMRPGLIYKDITKKPYLEGVHYGSRCIADFNNDGWPDIYAPGSGNKKHKERAGPQTLYKNNEGKLEKVELTELKFGGIPKPIDFNNDGNMDIFEFRGEDSRIYLGDGNFGFKDITETTGITSKGLLKGHYSHAYVADLDNDGDSDMIIQGIGIRILRNNGDGTVTSTSRNKNPWPETGHIRFDDYDMDGRLDVVSKGVGAAYRTRKESIRIFRNEIDNGNGWMKIQIRQADKNTMGIGAVVSIYKAGTRIYLGKQMVLSDTMGFHPRLHFGLAKHETVDIEVVYPTSKKTIKYPGISANRYIVLREDGSVADVVFGHDK